MLTKFAEHVWIMYRGDTFRASQIMQKRVFENPKITVVWNTEIKEIAGELTVSSVRLNSKDEMGKLKIKEGNTDKEVSVEEFGGQKLTANSQELSWTFPINGVFVAIGHTPNSKVFPGVETDEAGFIKVQNGMRTNIDRVFVAGDVHDHIYQQGVTAAGYGCQAALEAERYLRSQKE